jgi:hypothetical protein
LPVTARFDPPPTHDLQSIAAGVCLEYFPTGPLLAIRWGQQITRKKRRSIRLGSYNHETIEIRVHPFLNSPAVPRYFIESIIHHEYLHHHLGPDHNRRFHQNERKFSHHRQAQLWLKRNLHVLLGRNKPIRYMPGRPAPARPVQMALF